jgi:GT2 family glycosyltransferase
MHDLAIIMPTRNRHQIAAQNLRRTRQHFPNVPIYVFDDASDDAAAVAASIAMVPGCTLIRSDENVGPAGARRRLIEVADARWCLAIDDDCHPRDDFDPSRWVSLEPGPDDPIVVCCRYYRSYDGDVAPPGDLKVGPCRCLLGGASLLHRRSVIEIGSYNVAFIFGAEDTDLSRRVWASGRQIWIDPNNYIIHEHLPAGRNLTRESYFYVRNRIVLNVLSLPIWYGLPLGLVQAIRRCLVEPHKLSGLQGLLAGILVSARNFRVRRPLSIKLYRRLEMLPA